MNTIIQSFKDRYSNYFKGNITQEKLNKSINAETRTVTKNITQKQISRIQEMNISDHSARRVLQINRHNNITIEKNQVYSIPTDYGLINFNFVSDSTSRHVQTMYFDNQISDEKRVHLEKNRQFLTDLQIFAETGQISALYTSRDASEVLKGFENLGINTEEPFTMNDAPLRYRIDPSGVLHDVDLESKTMKEKDWRKYGHDENTTFVIQGKEYKMDKDGRLPLPEDYIHKYEQVKFIKN